MNTVNTLTIGLDKSGKEYQCPSCGQKRFKRMKNFETGELLPDHVGRCNRENNCGYHFTYKQFLQSTGQEIQITKKLIVTQPLEPIQYLPLELLEKSVFGGYDRSNFYYFLSSLFGEDIAKKSLIKYMVGRSREHNGTACIFWRIDKDEMIRTGKIMSYDAHTGKRIKTITPKWIHTQKKADGSYLVPQPFNFQLCFFGEHLLKEDSSKTVGIVESEKTAIIASVYIPEITWLATGGNSGCKWREWAVYNALKGRKVILFPDFGYFNAKTQRTCFEEWSERAKSISEKMECTISVSRVLEDKLDESERVNDYDLADMLIKRHEGKGLALQEYTNDSEGYPALWDLFSKHDLKLTA